MSIRIAILTSLGGGIGALFRGWINQLIPFASNVFSFGTFGINMLGCFLIGYLFSKLETESYRYFWITGILGGFTTFSGFGMEMYRYIQEKSMALVAIYGISSLLIGVFMVWAGQKLASA